MNIPIKKLHTDAVIPFYANPGDAGKDMTATTMVIDKYGNRSYGTGIAMAIPFGYVGLLFPRSSVSKYTLSLANCVGVIDSGFRGEISFKFKPTTIFQPGRNPQTFEAYPLEPKYCYDIGDRIGQIMIIPYEQYEFMETDDLDDTERGAGGYGSTGN